MPPPSPSPRSHLFGCAAGIAVLVLASCSEAGSPVSGGDENGGGLNCTIPEEQIADGGVGRGGIPALTNPPFVSPGDADASYLLPGDRVIGIRVDGEAYAIPHNILWWHEIVNLDLGETKLAVTYCPLTGSSLVFDRSVVGGSRFGVSGLLFQNNLIMFDEESDSFWPQMSRAARCGPASGTELVVFPAREMRWSRWKELHPEGSVVSRRTAFQSVRDYTLYPYDDYEELNNDRLLFPETMGETDGRRPPKERVLGIPTGPNAGVSFPFRALDQLGPVAAVERDVGGERIVVLWDRAGWAAGAFGVEADGGELSFEAMDGEIVDSETGSTWRFDGLATSGPLEGTRLDPVREAYVAFWFAWSAFHLANQLWLPSS